MASTIDASKTTKYLVIGPEFSVKATKVNKYLVLAPTPIVETPVTATQLPLLVVNLPVQKARITQLPVYVSSLPIQGAVVTQAPILPVWTPKPAPLPGPIVPEVPVVEEWEYYTIVNVAEKSKEQRSSLRSKPRVNVSFDAVILDDEDRRDVYNMFVKYISRKFNYPMYVYSTQLIAPASLGDNRLYFNPEFTHLNDGDVIALYNTQLGTTKMVTVSVVFSNGVTLTQPLTFAVGLNWLVCPAPEFKTKSSAGFTMDSVSGSITLNLEGTGASSVLRANQPASLTYIGKTLLMDKRPLAGAPEQFDQDMSWLDNEMASPEPRTSWVYPKFSGERQFLIHRPEGMDYWRSFANAVKGRWKSFLVPTFRNDLPVVGEPALGSSSFISSNLQYESLFRSKAWRYVSIKSDAGVMYTRVNDVVMNYDLSGDPVSIEVILAAEIGSAPGSNQNMVVSFVNLCRLDSDVFKFEHNYVDSILTLKLRMVEDASLFEQLGTIYRVTESGDRRVTEAGDPREIE